MELYTSLVRLKQEMNGGMLPVMTPIPATARHAIDPEFTIGLGAFAEDPEMGLRCPVVSCGVYRHKLARHLNTAHRDLGGANGVKRLLSVPVTAHLISQRSREKLVASCRQGHVSNRNWLDRARTARLPRNRSTRGTVGYMNLRNKCVAQLAHRIIDLQNKIGRSPCLREFESEYGRGLAATLRNAFGTWNNAKAYCGALAYPPGRTQNDLSQEQVLAALAAWHEVHGCLPSSGEAQRPHRAPLIPRYWVILRALNTKSWSHAMRVAASILNIYGGRYGLPVKAATLGSGGVTTSAGQSSSPEASAA